MKIVCGGQTGADRAAIEAAQALRSRGFEFGGWVPRGGWAEDYPQPPGLLRDYPEMSEMPTDNLAARTRRNVETSDATVILTLRSAGPSLGSVETLRAAREFDRPHALICVDAEDAEAALRDFLERAADRIRVLKGRPLAVLNVAGPRESEAPGLQSAASLLLQRVLGSPAPGRVGR